MRALLYYLLVAPVTLQLSVTQQCCYAFLISIAHYSHNFHVYNAQPFQPLLQPTLTEPVLIVTANYGFTMNSYDRHLHRSNIGRVPHMPSGIATIASSQMLDGGQTVQQKTARIIEALAKIDSTLVATNIQHLINGDKRRALEEVQTCSTTSSFSCVFYF
jgi:hypothetical protein